MLIVAYDAYIIMNKREIKLKNTFKKSEIKYKLYKS